MSKPTGGGGGKRSPEVQRRQFEFDDMHDSGEEEELRELREQLERQRAMGVPRRTTNPFTAPTGFGFAVPPRPPLGGGGSGAPARLPPL